MVAPHGRVPGLVTLGSAPLRALPRVTGAAGGSRGSRAGSGPPSVSARRSGVLAGPIQDHGARLLEAMATDPAAAWTRSGSR
jgi:hypothetical protein